MNRHNLSTTPCLRNPPTKLLPDTPVKPMLLIIPPGNARSTRPGLGDPRVMFGHREANPQDVVLPFATSPHHKTRTSEDNNTHIYLD
jgi:hypothetical protein